MSSVTLTFESDSRRRCNGCTLCCKLIPVRSIGKDAGTRCRHQTFKGCSIYARRPAECVFWTCRWLAADDTAELSRPDRSHYVIDVMPDYVTIVHDDTGERQTVPVVQIWVDPKYPEAHRDPALRRYLMRRGEQGTAAIIRYTATTGFVLWPPNMSTDGQWHATDTAASMREHSHTFEEIAAALSGAKP